MKDLSLFLFPKSKATIDVFTNFFIAKARDISSTVEHPLIRCGCLHDDFRDLSHLWEAIFHHFFNDFRLTHSVTKELHFDILKAIFPLTVPCLDVLYDSLMKVPDKLPRKAPHVVKHFETQQVSHFAFVHGQLQL